MGGPLHDSTQTVSTSTPGGAEVVRLRYYLGEALVVEHRPARGETSSVAVVLCPPLGYEETCSYRPLRVLADRIAEAGHVVLRQDWPGLGDSGLDDAHPALVDQWVRSAEGAVSHLRRRGFQHVVGIGVRAGGLLALKADGLDDLVLWGLPASGKAYLREEKAFNLLAAQDYGSPAEEVAPLPEGSLEAGGFFYNPATVAALHALTATQLAAEKPRGRVLLIPRDDGSLPAGLPEAFKTVNTSVSIATAQGLGVLLKDAYQSELSPEIVTAILEWIPSATDCMTRVPMEGRYRLEIGHGCTESLWTGQGGAGELCGVICEPEGGVVPGAAWTLFFNTGGIRRTGPNRLWTRAARALAAAGRPSLRLDVRDLGDSDGVSQPRTDLEELYSQASVADALVAIDALKARGAGSIDVVGICSGAFLGLHAAAQRDVRSALLINALAFIWDDDARAGGLSERLSGAVVDSRQWRRLLSGEIGLRRVMHAVGSKAKKTLSTLFSGRSKGVDSVEQLFQIVEKRGTAIHLVASQGDDSLAYLARHLDPERPRKQTIVSGVDHTFRPLWVHARLVDMVMGMGPALEGSQGQAMVIENRNAKGNQYVY